MSSLHDSSVNANQSAIASSFSSIVVDRNHYYGGSPYNHEQSNNLSDFTKMVSKEMKEIDNKALLDNEWDFVTP